MFFATVMSVCSSFLLISSDWTHPLGPNYDSRTEGSLSFDQEPQLKKLWQVPIGPAYSSMVIKDKQLITAFSRADDDLIACFSSADGKQQWQFRLGERYLGHDGSTDGPLSTPVVGGKHVFGLSAQGRLVSLQLSDGKLVWESDLAKQFAAEAPTYGFTTTPVYYANADKNLLVVQVGGTENRFLVAFNAETGAIVWSFGEGKADYGSPIISRLLDSDQVLASTSEQIVGLDVKNGNELWRYAFDKENPAASGMPMVLSGNRVLKRSRGGVTVIKLSKTDAGIQAEEQYVSAALGQTYPPPVEHGDYLYGFRGSILTCVNANTGERVWRSREPGGSGLILVDDYLVIFAAHGQVVVAKADPSAYLEVARTEALSGSSFSWPSFANDTVYVRNLEDMAAVQLVAEETPNPQMESSVDNLISDLTKAYQDADSDNREKVLADFTAKHPTAPILDGEEVHFIYRGEAKNVGLAGSMFNDSEIRDMTRLADSDLYFHSVNLPKNCRFQYRFQIDYETWVNDPNNYRQAPRLDDDEMWSEFKTHPLLRQETVKFESQLLKETRDVTVLLPMDYDKQKSYPLVVINDGEPWLSKADLPEHIAPSLQETAAVVALVPAAETWWLESGSEQAHTYARALVEELIPLLESSYNLKSDAAARTIWGTRYYAITALYTALTYPDVFGVAAMQSASSALIIRQDVLSAIEAGKGRSVRMYLDWNLFDERDIDRGYDSGKDSANLFELLKKGGYQVTGGQKIDSIGWKSWGQSSPAVLNFCLQAREAASLN